MNIRGGHDLSEADADALLSGRAVGHDDLREIVGLMSIASTLAAPTPTAALAAVLNEGFHPLPIASASAGSRWGRWSVRIAAATAAALSVTLGAAAANALPAPLQTAVADLVESLTPLELPRPAERSGSGTDDSGRPGEQPTGVPTSERAEDNPPTGPAEPSTAPVLVPSTPKAAVVAPPRATAPAADKDDAPDADEPDTDEAGSDAPEPDEPDEQVTEEPESGAPDADEPDADEPDADEPDADEPDADEPDADEPDADEPRLDEPDTDQLGSDQPDSGTELDHDDIDALD